MVYFSRRGGKSPTLAHKAIKMRRNQVIHCHCRRPKSATDVPESSPKSSKAPTPNLRAPTAPKSSPIGARCLNLATLSHTAKTPVLVPFEAPFYGSDICRKVEQSLRHLASNSCSSTTSISSRELQPRCEDVVVLLIMV